MKWALADDYAVALAGDRPAALALAAQLRPVAVLLDLGLPPSPGDTTEGMRALADLRALDPGIKVIIITGQGEREHAIQAIEEGAYDFLTKPIETAELKIILKRAFYLAGVERQAREARDQVGEDGLEGMLGASPQIQKVFATVRKVATADVPVLILGESGTGKEMVARAIHNLGSRKAGPFVAINCSAIPETLLESELFGHEKGAFTGAHVQRKGRIEMAAGGTLFLDEIGELPASVQVKLLRFLQDQRIERVGGRGAIEIDARVLAATNLDIRKAMTTGQFREDLYYRLAVVVIPIPPLREREGDIPYLARSFLRKYARETGRELAGFGRAALQVIARYDWPGNVREMENRIKRAVIMADHPQISVADLDLTAAELAPHLQTETLKEAREHLEREMIERALTRHNGKITAVAEALDISRPTLYEMMSRLGIQRT
jgi:two-component system NtrC family response regulator